MQKSYSFDFGINFKHFIPALVNSKNGNIFTISSIIGEFQ